MERAEPALKPEWLKSSSNGTLNHINSNNHHHSHLINSDEHSVGTSLSSRNQQSSYSSRRSLSSNGSNGSGKSKAYSSFGSCRREREKQVSITDNGSNGLDDNPLRRSRSMVSNNIVVTKGVSFDKEFPSLGENGSNGSNGLKRVETGRVSSPLLSVPLTGVERWNSVLVDVPVPVQTVNGNGSDGSNGSNGLNMAEKVAMAPSRVRTPPQLTVDMQKIEERTLKQFKQLIPVTPAMPKSSVASSLDKMKNKTTMQPLSPIMHSKPTQIGNFQVLNRDKTVISPPTISTKPVGPVASAVPQKSPTNRDRRVHSQSRDKLEFFKFIRNQSLGATSASLQEPQEKDKDEEKGVCEGMERRIVIGGEEGKVDAGLNGEMDLDPDPEEEAFLLSLGWDQNAEVDALTKEEIEAFVTKYKEVKQCSKVVS